MLPATLWSDQVLHLFMPQFSQLPLDDRPQKVTRLAMHPLDYAQLRHCAREAGCDVTSDDLLFGTDRMTTRGTLRAVEIGCSALVPEGEVDLFDKNDKLLGIIKLGH